MFEQIKRKIEELVELQKKQYTDLANRFDDPVARQTAWSPLVRGGSNFKTKSLHEISYNVLQYKPSMGMVLFSFIFIGIGLLVGIVLFASFLSARDTEISGDTVLILPLLFSQIFTLAGFLLLYFSSRGAYFDRTKGYFYKGTFNRNSKDAAAFHDIKALQIIPERVRSSSSSGGSSSSYTSYEINIVKNDASRVNVVDHGNYSAIVSDAEKISRFLNVPVWNACE